MYHLFKFGVHQGPQTPRFGTGLLLNGIICVLFGLLVIAEPELLAYLVAFFFIFIGASMLWTWWGFRNPPKHWSRNV